jgi:hypothetical protein
MKSKHVIDQFDENFCLSAQRSQQYKCGKNGCQLVGISQALFEQQKNKFQTSCDEN